MYEMNEKLRKLEYNIEAMEIGMGDLAQEDKDLALALLKLACTNLEGEFPEPSFNHDKSKIIDVDPVVYDAFQELLR